MRTSVLLLLVICAISMHVKIEEEFVHSHSVHKRLHHNANNARQQVTGEFTKNDAKPELIDTQLIVPITLGKQEARLVLDSTEAGTWVQSRKPSLTEGVCQNCPATTTPFQCTGTCTVDPDPTTPSPFTGYTTTGFQGRLSVVEYTAVEKKTVVAGSSVKDFRFGLVAKLDGTATDLANVLPNRGALGFGIGKARVQKYKDQKNQVNPLQADKPSTEQANLVRTLHQQNSGIIPQASVSIKLEDGLNIVTFGESEGYFKQGETQTYDNQATDNDNYQLLLSEFGYGAFPDEPTAAQVNGAPASLGTVPPPANAATQAVLDTTGRFFYFTEPFITNLVTVLNREGKVCVAPTETEPLVSCTCTDKDDIKKFKPLSFRFNSKKVVHRVQPQNYVQFVNGKCFVGVQQTTNAVATIGNVFFRDNYVTFNQDTTNVEISDAYPVAPTSLTMNQNDRYAFVVIGLVLALGSVLTLLSILKQIGFVPLTQSRVQAPEPHVVKTAPPPTQSVVYAYAPQPVYQQVVVGNPVYGQQPISSRSRHLPPGQYIR